MILTGKDVCSLMRRSRVRIRDLALRMQVTQKRIRYIREHGIADGNAARDWVEAITGTDPGPIPFRCRLSPDLPGTYCCDCNDTISPGKRVIRFGGQAFCTPQCAKRSHGDAFTSRWPNFSL